MWEAILQYIEMLNDVVKAVSMLDGGRLFIIDGIEHIFRETKQGALIHFMPHLNKVRVVHHLQDFESANRYYITYSILSKCFYFCTLTNLIEYNPLSGSIEAYEMSPKALWQYSAVFSNFTRYDFRAYQMTVSTDGHVYIGSAIYRGLYGYCRFNVLTKAFDDHALMPDREFTHIHGKGSAYAFVIANNAAFEGLYTSYLFADDYTHLRPVVLAEIATAGLTFSNTVEFLLHYSDRAVGSTKRRIYTRILGSDTWKVIDVKSPSTWIDTLNSYDFHGQSLSSPNGFACVDQAGNTVDKTGWLGTANLSVYAATFGITLPSFDSVFAYGYPFQVGRYVYIGINRMAGNIFYNFAIHPVTKEAIYPATFDKYSTFLSNPNANVYKCNFGGNFGFSNDHELVVFLNNGAGTWGFIRPDTHVWQAYNPSTNPDGYVIRLVNLYNINDPDGFGIRFGGSVFSELTETTINGDTCWVDGIGKSAMFDDYEQEVNGRLATVTFSVYPQKTRPQVKLDFTIDNLVVQTATISQSINLRDNLLVCVGRVYTGATVIDQTSPTTFNLKSYVGGTGSPNGVWRIDNNRVFIGVYMGKQHIIDATNPDNATRISLVGGDVTEALYASVHADALIYAGVPVRTASYNGGFRLTHVNLSTYAVTGITNRFPTEFNAVSSGTYRNLVGLSANDYSDAAVEAAVQARMTNAGLTRAQVIAEFVDSCRWAISDMHSWGNYTVFGLNYIGRRRLANIRIEETVGSGVWIDQNYQPATYPKAVLVNTTDIRNVQPSEIKSVEIQVGVSNYLGRVVGTDNYVAWVNHKIADGQGVINIVSKANLITAANGSGIITAFDNVGTVEFGGTSLSTVGFGDSVNFDSSATQQINCIAAKGDYIYITMRSLVGSSPRPAIIRVDCTDGTTTVFANTATNAVRTISINEITGKMVITTGTSVQVIDNFESATLPITI